MTNKTQKTTKVKKDINLDIIKQAVYDYVSEHKGKKAPTYEIIADITGLHINTIATYFKTLDFKTMVTPMRALTPQVLNNIYNLSHRSVAAQKLWMQIVEGWSERIEVRNDTVEFTEKQI